MAICFSPGNSGHLLVSTSSNKVVVLDAVSGHTLREVSQGTTGSGLPTLPCSCSLAPVPAALPQRGILRMLYSSYLVSAPEPAAPWLSVRMLICCWQPLTGPLQYGIIQHRRTPAARYVLCAVALQGWLRRPWRSK